MRRATEAWPIARVPVTVSIGVAMVRPDAQDPDDVLARADAALYAAKRSGRNRVCSGAQVPLGAAPAAEIAVARETSRSGTS